MPHLIAGRMAAVVAAISINSSTPIAQPSGSLLPPDLERMIEAMPPSARPAIRHMLENDPAARRRLELEATATTQKSPYWTKETVLRKIEAVFPGSDRPQILGQLESAQLSYRVQLAVIKLCDEGKGLSALAHNVNAAKLDYREVLMWAEYPNAGKLPPSAGDSDRARAGERDVEQYLRWIEKG